MESAAIEPHFNITVIETDIIAGAIEVVKLLRPQWPSDELLTKIFTNGISNKLVGVYYPGHYNEMVLVRVYGHKTDLLIDRKEEIKNIRILHKAGHTHSIYATFNNGLAYEFLQGDILTAETVRQPEIYKLIAKRMAEMHRLRPKFSGINPEPIIWIKTEKYMRIMPKKLADTDKQLKYSKLIKSYSTLQHEYQMLKENLSTLDSPVIFAHNDLLLTNVLHNQQENTVTFIDFEYAAYNYQAFDIANHFAEFAGVDTPDYSLYPDEVFQREWLRIYLEHFKDTADVSEEEVTTLYKQVNEFVLLSHFFWGCWALIQSQYSLIDFDFLEYAADRFNEYFKRKQNNRSVENCIRAI